MRALSSDYTVKPGMTLRRFLMVSNPDQDSSDVLLAVDLGEYRKNKRPFPPLASAPLPLASPHPALAHRGWKQPARAAGHGPAGSPAWADSSDERV
jgi:hypothetical protein